MKVAIVSQYYKPENAKIPTTVAEELSKRGHIVRVITAFPNYPEGKIFPGYKQKIGYSENHGLVAIRRVPIWISHSSNALGRITNYVSFALASLGAGRFVRSADVTYVYATQMTAAFAPWIWSFISRKPYVLHVQDLWPESITGSPMSGGRWTNKVITFLLNPWLRAVYRRAAGVIAIAPTMRKMLVSRGAPPGRAHTVYNWTDGSAERIIDTSERVGTTVLYAGNLGPLQDLKTAIAAAHAVQDLDGFSLWLVGSGLAEAQLRDHAAQLGVENVTFAGRVSVDEMHEVYAQADFQLVSLQKLPIFEGTIPSKFQSGLATGLPLITAVHGDVERLVRDNGLGIVVPPENPEELANAFRRAHAMSPEARRDFSVKGRDFYEKEMSMEKSIGEIERILVTAANGNSRSGK